MVRYECPCGYVYLFTIKTCEKFNRRHMSDILRIKFFAQHRNADIGQIGHVMNGI